MNPFWITFYSYKGGVGRSLALANAAALLVQRGRRVVLVDFDLEAPGLDSFKEFESTAGQAGVVEYVTEFKTTNRAPDISKFVHKCRLEGQPRGQLWLMPAGKKGPTYNACRENIKWAELYESGLGQPFIENWKAAIARHCQPDYVFVDSRTGLTDVGGICTLHLPDLVVMLFGLNQQNIEGVAAVAKTIRDSDLSRLPQIHYVASPVPNLPPDKDGPLGQRLAAATERIGTKIKSSIRYQYVAALNERLFALDPDLKYSPLVQDYRNLLSSLTDYNRNGLDLLLTQTDDAIKAADTSLIQRLLTVFEDGFPDRPEALMARAKLKKALQDSAEAKRLAQQALDADPAYDEAFRWLLAIHRREKDYQTALALCDSLLQHTARLSPELCYQVHLDRGQSAMSAENYAAAVESYHECIRYQSEIFKKPAPDPEVTLMLFFNVREALRRHTRTVDPDRWYSLIRLFVEGGQATAAPLVIQANHWQAMHIPFALTGDLEAARSALIKARMAAELLGAAEDIFTVKTYTEVSVQEFVANNDEMLAALEQGRLWDGMPTRATKWERQSNKERNTELET
jgi:cellulose biosynthesis protein BcsQ